MGNTFKTGNYVNGIFQDTSNNIGIGAAPSGTYKFEITGTSKVSGVLTLGATLSNGTYTYTLPAATGTLALVGGAGVGTVTSVAALTIGTSGTDLSSTVANSTTTPVITLNVPTASATNRGALASADFTTFNSKQGTITLTTTGTSGAATFSANTLNIPNYGSALSGYLPLSGGTLTGGLIGTTASFSGDITSGGSSQNLFIANGTTYSGFKLQRASVNKWATFNNNAGTDFYDIYNYGTSSSSLKINFTTNEVTLTGALSGTSAAFSGNLEIFSGSAGVTVGDFLVNPTTKYVYVGRQSSTSGDNTTFVVRDRTGSARATIPGGGSIDTVFSTNNSNFIVSNYSGNSLMTIANTGAATFSSSVTATGGINGYSGLNGYAGVTHNFFVDWSAESQITTLTNTNLFFGTNAQRRMTIMGGGNVLIGTTTDDTVNKLQVQGSASIKSFIKLNTLEAPSVSTSAVTISTVNNTYGGIAIVWGNDSGNIFTDLVFYSLSSTYVINGQSISGSPVGRTYTCVSGDLKLAMASGTYSVRFQAIVTT